MKKSEVLARLLDMLKETQESECDAYSQGDDDWQRECLHTINTLNDIIHLVQDITVLD